MIYGECTGGQVCQVSAHEHEVVNRPYIISCCDLKQIRKKIKSQYSTPLFTFSDAECVVSAGDKVIKCNEEVGVALGRPQ